MRMRKLLVVVAALAVVVAGGAVVLRPKSIVPGLTQENFDSVHEGMSLPEVETLLGEPYLHYGGGFTRPSYVHPDMGFWAWNHEGDGLQAVVSVSFDQSGKVSAKYSDIYLVREPFPLSNPLNWLKRQWHRWFQE